MIKNALWYTFVSVKSRPRIDVTTMHPTRRKDTCWEKKGTSMDNPSQLTAISRPRVTGSTLPTRSNTMLMVLCKNSRVVHVFDIIKMIKSKQYNLSTTYDEYFPTTVNWEKVAQKIEIFALPCCGPFKFFFHHVRINSFDKKMSTELF